MVSTCGWDAVLVVAGRRGGKSEELSRWVTYEAIYGAHEVTLAPGQVGVIAVVCPEQKHAKEFSVTQGVGDAAGR